MDLQLRGRHALVTGSTAGIGRAVARALAEEGARVTINGRHAEGVSAALQRLRADCPDADLHGVAADVGTAEGCARLLDAVAAAGAPPVDILVNNLGIFDPKPFVAIADADWQRFFDVIVMSGVRLSRALLPAMTARGWGRVVFISSESARNIPADMVHYGVSKTAQLALSRGLAKRVAGSGVTVNAVLPGPTVSDGFKAMFAAEAERSGKSIEALGKAFVMAQRPSSVIQRPASVDEVASMVVYVCSPQASATSGAALRVDGGVIDDIV